MESIEMHYDTIVIKYEKHSVNITGMFSSQFLNTILKMLDKLFTDSFLGFQHINHIKHLFRA